MPTPNAARQTNKTRTSATGNRRCTARPEHTPPSQGGGMSGLEAVARTSGGLLGGTGIGGVHPGRGEFTGLLTFPLWHGSGQSPGYPQHNQGSFRGSPTVAVPPFFG